ncbi:MAG: hypothetical protein GY906_28775 [bacterium]|nr:hypothetical protein [bacterium]
MIAIRRFGLVFVCLFLLSIASALHATILTVGPSGSYATIQTAIDEALLVPGFHDIRVQTGTYIENLYIGTVNAGVIRMSGGWNSFFNNQTASPWLTKINGGSAGRVVELNHTGGSVQIYNFTITDGFLDTFDSQGGGVYISLINGAQVRMSNCNIVKNELNGDLGANGGGLFADLSDISSLYVKGCRFRNNRIVANVTTFGAGMFVYMHDYSRLYIQGGDFTQNRSYKGQYVNGGGIAVVSRDQSFFKIRRCHLRGNAIWSNPLGDCHGAGIYTLLREVSSGVIEDNYIRSNSTNGPGTSRGAGGYIRAAGEYAKVTLRRNSWLESWDNTMGTDRENVYLRALGKSKLEFTDSVIAKGNTMGLRAVATMDATVALTNLTVADYVGTGIEVDRGPSAVLNLYNSISFGTGVDLITLGAPTTGSNHTGSDPLFVNPAGNNYSLQPNSPAIDTGSNVPVLGPLDVWRRPRVVNTVDIGAWEYQN